ANAQYYVYRASAYQYIGNMDRAVANSERALHLRPTETDLEVLLAVSTECIRLSPSDSRGWLIRGNAYLKMGHYCQAIHDITEALHVQPANALAFTLRANAYFAIHDLVRGDSDSSQAIQCDPTIAHAWLIRGIIHSAKGRYIQAIQAFD